MQRRTRRGAGELQKESSVVSTSSTPFGRERDVSVEPDAPRRRRLIIRLEKLGPAEAEVEQPPGPAEAEVQQPSGPGEFTKLFGRPTEAPAEPPATAAAGGAPPGTGKLMSHPTSDYLSALDAGAPVPHEPDAIDRAEPPPSESAEAEAPPAAAATPVAEGPSEYTKVVSGRQPAPAAPVSSPAAFFQRRKERMVHVSAARRPRLRFLVLWLVIIVAAGAAVVYFLTRP
jgi:hypothetical protein